MKKKHSIKKSLITFCFSAVIIIFALYFIFNDFGVYQLFRLKNKKNTLTKEIINKKEQKKNITEQIKRLSEDSLYIEKIAREKYFMVKKGEIIIPIIKK